MKLAVQMLLGTEERPAKDQWGTVRAWFAARGWCEHDPRLGDEVAKLDPVAVKVAPPIPRDGPPTRLPPEEVRAMWDGAWPVFTEYRANRWCMARGLEPWRVAGMDVARSLAPHGHDYRWARSGGVPWRDGHTLLLPCFGAGGDLVGLRSRWTGADFDDDAGSWVETAAAGGRKEISPSGRGALRGTLYADLVGRWILRTGPKAVKGAVFDDEAPGLSWDGRVLIIEGGPAWLRYASSDGRVTTRDDGSASTYAVFGIWSGAWPDDEMGDDLAERMKGASLVALAMDDDKAGSGYARRIGDALRSAGVPVVVANSAGA